MKSKQESIYLLKKKRDAILLQLETEDFDSLYEELESVEYAINEAEYEC